MALPGTAQAAAAGFLGFDTDSIVSASKAAEFFTQGFRFCVRYVSRVAQQGLSDLSAAEAVDLLKAELALMPVQHVRAQSWIPSSDLGSSDGVHAAYHAFVLGFPPGVNVWCDLEGVRQGTSAQQVIGYCNAWYDAVAAAGYVPGLYVGANSILNGKALGLSLKFAHYWKSLSSVPNIDGRGYQMIQSKQHAVGEINIDEDRTQTDKLGGKVLWLALSPVATARERHRSKKRGRARSMMTRRSRS